MTASLTLPSSFRTTALSFPDKVKAAIAKIENPEDAADGVAQAQALAIYAKRIKATAEEVNHIEYGKLLLAARYGELCPAMSRQEAGSKKGSTRDVQPFHRNTLADYRKLAKHQNGGNVDTYFTAIANAEHDAEVSLAGFFRYIGSDGNIKANQNKGVIEWYTPEKYIKSARKVMGGIDLDPASSEMANETVQAKCYYDQEDDGLDHEWGGRVFMNPPFKASLISKFVHKLCQHHEQAEVTQAILLTNNSTDTRWWHQAANQCAAICFTEGRVAFYSPLGETAAPTNGHTFFYFGEKTEKFAEFGEYGFSLEMAE